MKSYELKQQINDKQRQIDEYREKLENLKNVLEIREFNEDEDGSFKSATDELSKLKNEKNDLESRVRKLETIESVEVVSEEKESVPAIRSARYGISLDDDRNDNGSVYASREYNSAWVSHLQTGDSIRTNAASFLANTPAAGGYTIAPVAVSKKIITNINNAAPLQNIITKYPLENAVAFRVPRLSTDPAPPTFNTEGQCLSPDLTSAFSTVDITPQLMAELVTISWQMVTLGGQPLVDFVINRLSYLFTRRFEQGIATGTGTNGDFLGVFTASANGVPTSQDVATATAGTLVGDDLINAVAALNPSIQNTATTVWYMHPTTLAVIRKLKDTQGRYLLEPSLAAGTPPTLVGIPVYQSYYAPAYSATSGSYVAVLGDFSYYWQAEYNDSFQIQRLMERYADCNIQGIMGRRWANGAPIQGSAFVRVKIQ